MVSRFLRPVLHWTQETLRVAAPALAASARGTLGAALGSVLGGRDAAPRGQPHQPFGEQRRHRWAGTKEFGSEQAVRGCACNVVERMGFVCVAGCVALLLVHHGGESDGL